MAQGHRSLIQSQWFVSGLTGCPYARHIYTCSSQVGHLSALLAHRDKMNGSKPPIPLSCWCLTRPEAESVMVLPCAHSLGRKEFGLLKERLRRTVNCSSLSLQSCSTTHPNILGWPQMQEREGISSNNGWHLAYMVLCSRRSHHLGLLLLYASE